MNLKYHKIMADSPYQTNTRQISTPCSHIPPPEEQVRIIRSLMSENCLKCAENGAFVISAKWFAKWKQIVGFSDEPPIPRATIPQIDNSDIIKKGELDYSLKENFDYFVILPEVWNQLLEWFNGGPPICVPVRYNLDRKPTPLIHPFTVLVTYGDSQNVPFQVFNQTYFFELEDQVRSQFKISKSVEIRMIDPERRRPFNGRNTMQSCKIDSQAKLLADYKVMKTGSWHFDLTKHSIKESEALNNGTFTNSFLRDFTNNLKKSYLAKHSFKNIQNQDVSGNDVFQVYYSSNDTNNNDNNEYQMNNNRNLNILNSNNYNNRNSTNNTATTRINNQIKEQTNSQKENNPQIENNSQMKKNPQIETNSQIENNSQMEKNPQMNSESDVTINKFKNENNSFFDPNETPVDDSADKYSSDDIKGPGICGLRNLGNTCYFNSALQCLLHIPAFSEYFFNINWKTCINMTNRIGSKGEITSAYAALNDDFWSGKYSIIPPLKLKETIGKFAIQFAGTAQQDAHELLTFLLDGIHEDLNRSSVKTSFPPQRTNGTQDVAAAKDRWNRHKYKNDSIVVDLFHGLLRSQVTCPLCHKMTVVFDPYMTLSLPLAKPKFHTLSIIFVPYDFQLPYQKFQIIFQYPNEIIPIICQHVGRMMNIVIVNRQRVGDENRFSWGYFDDRPYTDYYAIEVPNIYTNYNPQHNNDQPYNHSQFNNPNASHNGVMYDGPVLMKFVACVLKVKQRKEIIIDETRRTVTKEISAPFLIPVENFLISREAFHQKVDQYFNFLWMKNAETVYDQTTTDKITDFITKMASNRDSEINFKDQRLIVDFPDEYYIINNREQYFKEAPYFPLVSHIFYTIYVNPECMSLPNFNFYSYLFHIDDVKCIPGYQTKEKITLEKCFSYFSEPEILDFNNKWYCHHCRQEVTANKKMDIWSAPKILIIQLKRFVSQNGFMKKIDCDVQYPSVLDMSPYLVDPDKTEKCEYQLIGVSEHMGGLAGGHYIAHAFVNAPNRLTKPLNIITPPAHSQTASVHSPNIHPQEALITKVNPYETANLFTQISPQSSSLQPPLIQTSSIQQAQSPSQWKPQFSIQPPISIPPPSPPLPPPLPPPPPNPQLAPSSQPQLLPTYHQQAYPQTQTYVSTQPQHQDYYQCIQFPSGIDTSYVLPPLQQTSQQPQQHTFLQIHQNQISLQQQYQEQQQQYQESLNKYEESFKRYQQQQQLYDQQKHLFQQQQQLYDQQKHLFQQQQQQQQLYQQQQRLNYSLYPEYKEYQHPSQQHKFQQPESHNPQNMYQQHDLYQPDLCHHDIEINGPFKSESQQKHEERYLQQQELQKQEPQKQQQQQQSQSNSTMKTRRQTHTSNKKTNQFPTPQITQEYNQTDTKENLHDFIDDPNNAMNHTEVNQTKRGRLKKVIKSWYRFNDSTVTKETLEDAHTHNAYLLFYEKITKE
ncbi:hypothetical protein TRFO_07210 [Tritrichomonas foetus]|uniref:ubiquitinyl hydrolase 1 n=1 Tax=Tritrichomonas foetus TaxID=1144522 RepID=A0A1J4JTA1_9EUKA|nr:hypothetical protein TRFO_07210 [Tritrichomonas foetus]|eukprot:OHT02353.1 hypothetical protein TRFO_07210 [Tritrichomonas foetus]